MSKFVVGEVAIVTYSALSFLPAGSDVTILEVAADSKWQYRLDVKPPEPWPDGDVWTCDAHLRKKRPPQDWKRLCQLDAAPTQRETEPA